ncbi:hypothetical protein IL306_003196 [Fusarium sp. DS 682]|nr:hypothetical protein IL306_003196 [Fusarium sp. DS 682]
MSSDATASKPIHSLVLDTGPLIKNDPPANTLRAKAEQLYTLPCIISEIRDAATRARVETTLLPFVTLRSPNPESVKVIRDFARRTGDLAVLSKPDIEVLALGYELECERNGGDWRLRKTPGQKGLNGKPNKTVEAEAETKGDAPETEKVEETLEKAVDNLTIENPVEPTVGESSQSTEAKDTVAETVAEPKDADATEVTDAITETDATAQTAPGEKVDETIEAVEEASDGEASDDEGGWITPSNLKKHQATDTGATPSAPVQKTLQAAVLTSDYAMQNVALRMNLNLVAPSLARITHLKNWVLRCHGCFKITKEMNKQFCPSCGQPTLNRVSCSTDEHGNFKIHLKKNFQWNNRGNVYSVPKPVHGSANGRLPKNAGGKNGWGNNLILAEDQKEFTRAADEQRRQRKKDIMDQDYLPDLLTGHRAGGGQKIRVGAGRNVNSKKKH